MAGYKRQELCVLQDRLSCPCVMYGYTEPQVTPTLIKTHPLKSISYSTCAFMEYTSSSANSANPLFCAKVKFDLQLPPKASFWAISLIQPRTVMHTPIQSALRHSKNVPTLQTCNPPPHQDTATLPTIFQSSNSSQDENLRANAEASSQYEGGNGHVEGVG